MYKFLLRAINFIDYIINKINKIIKDFISKNMWFLDDILIKECTKEKRMQYWIKETIINLL